VETPSKSDGVGGGGSSASNSSSSLQQPAQMIRKRYRHALRNKAAKKIEFSPGKRKMEMEWRNGNQDEVESRI